MKVALRPVTPSDNDLLFEIYAGMRRDEVSAWGWDLAQEDAFLRMQFTVQQRSLAMQYEHLSHDAVIVDDEPIGRLLVNRPGNEIHLVDIALLPALRGRGIGTTLIRTLLDEGDHIGLPVRLKVMKDNPAALLYERLGFVKTGESELHNHMERSPFGVQ